MTEFTKQCIDIIKKIPMGEVATYGDIALYAGNPRGARQVSRILHSMSKKHDLPWHRIINSKGTISLTGNGLELQKELLISEGVEVDCNGKIDLSKYRTSYFELM